MQKIWVVIRKEWSEVFKNRFVLFTVAFLPLMLTAIPLLILYFTGSDTGLGGLTTGDIPPSFLKVCGDLGPADCAQYYLISEFMLLFMILPLAIPVTIASYSIVGEKTTRTLEPVLATPITTFELLAGKALAAITPAVLATWGGFALFGIGARLLTHSAPVSARLLDPLWLLAVFLVGPLLSIAAVSVAVMVSSRATEPRVAEQMSMLVILPLMAVFLSTILGLIVLNERMILWMAVVVSAIDVVLGTLAVRIFQRETILTRWK